MGVSHVVAHRTPGDDRIRPTCRMGQMGGCGVPRECGPGRAPAIRTWHSPPLIEPIQTRCRALTVAR